MEKTILPLILPCLKKNGNNRKEMKEIFLSSVDFQDLSLNNKIDFPSYNKASRNLHTFGSQDYNDKLAFHEVSSLLNQVPVFFHE